MTKPILYDGWPLAHTPNSPAALHLLTILELLPEDTPAVIALPNEPPEWFKTPFETTHQSIQDPRQWTQKILPTLQKQHSAILHTTRPAAPFRPNSPVIVSPTGYGRQERPTKGFSARIGGALAQGGAAQALILQPSDLPSQKNQATLPPIVHSAFIPADTDDPPNLLNIKLPETYILYHGPTGFKTVRKVLETWTWAGPAIGDFYPLLLAGLDAETRGYVEYLLPEYGIENTVRILPSLPPDQLAVVYQFCSALFHPAGVSSWGGPVRRALACGRPVVALPDSRLEAVVGPAALILDAKDARSLSSGLIAITIKDQIIDDLLESSIKRAAPWHNSEFISQLFDLYQNI